MIKDGIAGFVLAGGRSRRMGRDKALLPYGDTTMIEHALQTLRGVCDEVAIAGSRNDLAEFAPVIADIYMESGPLAGMHAALEQSQHAWNIFLGVDMPQVTAEHLQRLLDAPQGWHTVAVLAEANGRLQPLCGLYRSSIADGIARAIGAGERAVIPALETICGPSGMVRVVFPDADAFLNVNTPEEMATLKAARSSI